MNIQTSKGMGIKTGKGLGLTTSKGMGLSSEKNYFKFNEYERQHRYLFGDRGKGNNKKKPKPKPAEKPVEKKPEEEKRPPEENPPEPKPEAPKEAEADKEQLIIPARVISDLREGGDLPTTRLPPLEPAPQLHGKSLGSMQRMLKLFN